VWYDVLIVWFTSGKFGAEGTNGGPGSRKCDSEACYLYSAGAPERIWRQRCGVAAIEAIGVTVPGTGESFRGK